MTDALLPQDGRDLRYRSADEDLLSAKQRLDLAIECAGLGVFDWDTTDDRLTWNEQMFQIFGVEPATFTGQYDDFANRVHPEDRERVLGEVQTTIATGEDFVTEYRVLPASDEGPTGRLRYVAAHARLHASRDGRHDRLIGVCIDITDRVTAEAEHRRYENLMRATEELAGIGSWEFHLPDPDPLLSEQTLRVFGLPPDARPDLETCISFYHAEYRPLIRRQLQRLLERGDPLKFEARLRRADNRDVWVKALGHAERDEHGEVRRVFGSFQEITEQKEAERRLREQTMLQTLLFRELDHRVRNNLASLTSLVEMTREKATSVERFAESIRRRIEAVSRVHELLSKSHYEPVSLREIIETATDATASSAEQVRAGGPAVRVPARQVTAVAIILVEVLNNSLKYGALSVAGGGIDIAWSVETSEYVTITLTATERGGPVITETPEPGTGTELIEGLAQAELRGAAIFDFPRDGASVTITMTLDAELPTMSR
jgi:PAS domain S-box-containing protein